MIPLCLILTSHAKIPFTRQQIHGTATHTKQNSRRNKLIREKSRVAQHKKTPSPGRKAQLRGMKTPSPVRKAHLRAMKTLSPGAYSLLDDNLKRSRSIDSLNVRSQHARNEMHFQHFAVSNTSSTVDTVTAKTT